MPTQSAQLILELDIAIAYSYNWLQYWGLEHGLAYDRAQYIQVEFPNGDLGVFVAMGFSGPARGYQFLYRVEDDYATLVELVEDSIDWGIRTLENFEKVDIETLQLFYDSVGNLVQVLKVTGSGHLGTGLWKEGFFQIINITEDGMAVIFTGLEADLNANSQGYHREYTYQYRDLNGDGILEIVQDGVECQYQPAAEGFGKTNCQEIQRIYEFNGREYIQKHDL